MNIRQDRCQALTRCGVVKSMCINPEKNPEGIFGVICVRNWFE